MKVEATEASFLLNFYNTFLLLSHIKEVLFFFFGVLFQYILLQHIFGILLKILTECDIDNTDAVLLVY